MPDRIPPIRPADGPLIPRLPGGGSTPRNDWRCRLVPDRHPRSASGAGRARSVRRTGPAPRRAPERTRRSDETECYVCASRSSHYIAHAAHSMDQLRFARIDFQPEQADESFKGIFIHFAPVTPHRFENRLAADDAAWIAHEQFEKPIFARRETDILVTPRHVTRGGIEFYVRDLKTDRARNRAAAADGAQ